LRNANGFGKEDFSKQRKEFRSIIPPLCKAFGPSFLMGAFFKFGYDILQFVSPEILRLSLLMCKFINTLFFKKISQFVYFLAS
jgi:hypothetical protein